MVAATVTAAEMAAAVASILIEEGVVDPRMDDFLGLARRYANTNV